MKEKNVITISENETKKNLSVTRLIRVTLFSELTLETVIKNYQIKTTEMYMASCALITQIFLTRTGFQISVIVHYSYVDPDAYFEMLLHHLIADH